MRLLTFNAASGDRAKRAALLSSLPFDVASFQEVPKPAEQNDQHLWFGTNPNKGVSVQATGDYRLAALPVRDDVQPFFVPVDVTGPNAFLLIAVWAQKEPAKYIEAVSAAISAHADLIRSRPTVLLGDFNSNTRFNKEHPAEHNHDAVVAALAELGCVSAYHEKRGEAHGAEASPTYFHQWKESQPFHLDYVFTPAAWSARLREVSVGSFALGNGVSDHRPVTAILD